MCTSNTNDPIRAITLEDIRTALKVAYPDCSIRTEPESLGIIVAHEPFDYYIRFSVYVWYSLSCELLLNGITIDLSFIHKNGTETDFSHIAEAKLETLCKTIAHEAVVSSFRQVRSGTSTSLHVVRTEVVCLNELVQTIKRTISLLVSESSILSNLVWPLSKKIRLSDHDLAMIPAAGTA